MDAFNTKELINEAEHIKKFDKFFTNEMLNLSKIYIETLEEFRKNRC
jgi:CO dehydrogenase/acetyl-CoA synthase gamma subunit (corrinoid Fe-S protein)